MLNTQNRLLLQASETQQVPHRAPVPEWANGNGEEGAAREGQTEPATDSSVLSFISNLKKSA